MNREINNKYRVNEVTFGETSRMLKFINTLERFTISFNNILHKISSSILMFLMFLTTADVIGRYFLNSPITGIYELTGLLLVLSIFYSLGSAQLKNNHVEIDILTKKMQGKNQDILKSFSSFILFILLCLTMWQLFEYTKRVWVSRETSGNLGLPIYFFSALSIFGAFAFVLTLLLDSLKSFIKVVKRNES